MLCNRVFVCLFVCLFYNNSFIVYSMCNISLLVVVVVVVYFIYVQGYRCGVRNGS